MATRVEQSTESIPTGISYAGAVLNRKVGSDSNKENIEMHSVDKSVQNKPPRVEEFPQIAPKTVRSRPLERKSRPRKIVERSAERKSSHGDDEAESVKEEIKFVEAPLPKVNPWMKKAVVEEEQSAEDVPVEVAKPPDKQQVISHEEPAGELSLMLLRLDSTMLT